MRKVTWIVVVLAITLSGIGLWSGFTSFLAVIVGLFLGFSCFWLSRWITGALVAQRVTSNRPVFIFGLLKWLAIGGGFALVYVIDSKALVWYFIALMMVYFLLVVGALFEGVAPTSFE
ncbi:MAG TPA: hypothetical protein VNK96_06360 [Fimbriimonadales bacterium]|nr:hypothetical protein [Fimbriimonadales bacterium]